MEEKKLEWILVTPSSSQLSMFSAGMKTVVHNIDGGWLFKYQYTGGRSSPKNAQAITFIPDQKHEWSVNEIKESWEILEKRSTCNYVDDTARIRVFGGWVYRSIFANKVTMQISLLFSPETEVASKD